MKLVAFEAEVRRIMEDALGSLIDLHPEVHDREFLAKYRDGHILFSLDGKSVFAAVQVTVKANTNFKGDY